MLNINRILSGLFAVSGGPGLDQGPADNYLRQVDDQTEQEEHGPQHGEGLAENGVGGFGRA